MASVGMTHGSVDLRNNRALSLSKGKEMRASVGFSARLLWPFIDESDF